MDAIARRLQPQLLPIALGAPLRDVGKALGLDDELINRLAKSIFCWESDLEEQLSDSGIDYTEPKIKALITLAQSLMGFPRHLSQHVGGFVISQGDLTHLVPIENAAMADRTIIQWDKDDLESLAYLKSTCSRWVC